MLAPIIVVDGGDLIVFKSAHDAERGLESPDVMSGSYVAYDSEGRLLKLEVPDPGNCSGFLVDVRPVKITAAESKPTHAGELSAAVKAYLRNIQVAEEWVANASLSDLLLQLVTRSGFAK
ncbi:conserved protein of unknown function [Nitrospira defluvii]|jgi:hypothetical protein|uniref:Uncharacterized protein n=1 Tax=Nitrospira defluvii TaxID=330214 RepID=D8PCR2_9BACT|nr:conserved protein of unknown function [Nitrospira defluvii]